MLDLHRDNRLLNLIINDRGRFLVNLVVLDLHFRREDDGIGLTPGRLKAICTEKAICSATRANTLLTLMRIGGYVAPASASGDRRRRELVPTERLLAAQRERWRCQFEGAAPFLPDAVRALEEIDEPGFMAAMIRRIGTYFYAGFRPLDHTPALRLFGERNGGFFVLLALLAATEQDAHPAATISISELARGAGCSRAHINKLLADAAAQGLIERQGTGTIAMLPPLANDAYDFIAVGFLFLTHCARLTLETALPPALASQDMHNQADATLSASAPSGPAFSRA